MAADADQANLSRMTTAELGAFIDRYKIESPDPAFEELFDGLKNVVKGVATAVKKGVKGAAKIAGTLGFGWVFKKLAGVLKNFLNQKVLAFAFKHVPPGLHRYAEKLKGLSMLKEAQEIDPEEMDVSALQLELDMELADVLFAESETELAMVEAESAQPLEDRDADREAATLALHQVRERFIDQIRDFNDDRKIEPHVEEFIPAVLTALRLGFRVLGRRRVMSFLTKETSKLIGRLVGPEAAAPLSKALVDAGFKLLNLEATPDDEARAAATAVAATVEDMTRRVASLPDVVLDNEELLEAFTVRAFEDAAASNLPPIFSEDIYRRRPDLREEKSYRGVWVALPLRGRKLYKKYTRAPRVRISPRKAALIQSTEGMPLSIFMRDRVGSAAGDEVEARIHLYETMPGCTTFVLARQERTVSGESAPAHYTELHPLTREAAALLLDEPELGRDIDANRLAGPMSAEPGLRYYFLEIPGSARLRRRRASRLRVTVHLPSNELQILFYLGEPEAQDVAERLRKSGGPGAAIAWLQRALERHLAIAFGRAGRGGLRIIDAAAAPHDNKGSVIRSASPVLLERFSLHVEAWMLETLADYFKTKTEVFLQATDHPADGVTLLMTFAGPRLDVFRTVLKGGALPTERTSLGVVSERNVRVMPGYARA
jgi:hypothetical protein